MTAIHGVLAGGTEDAGSLTVAIAPSSLNEVDSSSPLTTSLAIALPSGGSGFYTYAWTLLSSSSVTAVVNSPTSATTSFSCEVDPSGYEDATFRCTVTDLSSPNPTGYANIYVQFVRI